MRTKEEIENRIFEAELQMEHLKDWHEKVENQYKKEKEFWGKDTDDTEMRVVSDHIGEVLQEIKILKWVLNKQI